MARQCAIVVQRCAQAREGEEEGGVLGQLGKLIIPGNPERFLDSHKSGAHSHPGCGQMGLWVRRLV